MDVHTVGSLADFLYQRRESISCWESAATALSLEAAIPYRNRLNTRDEMFQRLLKACNGIKVQSDKYEPNCFFARNRYMVSLSDRVIAVYDGRERGGTLFTMRYAHALKKEVRVIQL